jgi:hypothetical protein
MNTNVGEMPLDIFSDYISDILGEEWTWEYLILILNCCNTSMLRNEGCGGLGYMPSIEHDAGDGYSYDYADEFNDGIGSGSSFTIFGKFGDGGQKSANQGNGWIVENFEA